MPEGKLRWTCHIYTTGIKLTRSYGMELRAPKGREGGTVVTYKQRNKRTEKKKWNLKLSTKNGTQFQKRMKIETVPLRLEASKIEWVNECGPASSIINYVK